MKIMSILVVVIILVYVISKRNQFNKLRRSVKNEAANIGIQIAKRSACLNDALNISKISYGNEVAGIEKLTASDQLNQLAYLGEKYPSLQSVSGYNDTLREAFELNKDISATRELLNRNIRNYNDAITEFPGMIVAAMFGYKEEKFVDEENIEANKKLDKREVDFTQF